MEKRKMGLLVYQQLKEADQKNTEADEVFQWMRVHIYTDYNPYLTSKLIDKIYLSLFSSYGIESFFSFEF